MTQTGNIRNMGRAFPAVALALTIALALALIIAPGGAYGEASVFQASTASDSSAGGEGTMDQGQVVTFPGPKEVAPSPYYTVDIRQGERTYNSFTYISQNQFPEVNINSDDTSWTTFEFSGNVTVIVTAHHTTVDSCRILPSRRGVKTRIAGNRCEFDLSRPGKFSVEINGDIRHPLLVFADPLDTEPVPEPGPDVI